MRRLSLLVALTLAACQAPIRRAEVARLLDRQVAAWNRGDLEGFLSSYSHGRGLTALGSHGLRRGFETLAQGYREGFPSAEAMGQLAFELLEVRPLGTTAALVLGSFVVRSERPSHGFFTLLVERKAGMLRITHDHTTAVGEGG